MSIEATVYISIKRYLKVAGWHLIGGQPPSGTDSLPVIEIKSNFGSQRGSRDSMKPDLLAVQRDELLVLELKPKYSRTDHIKLQSLLDSPGRIEALWEALRERNIRDENGDVLFTRKSKMKLIVGLGHTELKPALSEVWQFIKSDESFLAIPPTTREN